MKETGSRKDDMLINGTGNYIPHLSVDCVVFGFNRNQLKVMLLKMPEQREMALPGGYVRQNESLEDAANRVLNERTGLENVFLEQFHTFSAVNRVNTNFPREPLKKLGFPDDTIEWLSRRFVTVGFYALVDFAKVVPEPDIFSVECNWYALDQCGTLMMDHNEILEQALQRLRKDLFNKPIGLNLLPHKFTMPELRQLYETILGRKLDRRNFQRKIQSYKILVDLNERKTGVAHKAPLLYRFDRQQYNMALEHGFKGGL